MSIVQVPRYLKGYVKTTIGLLLRLWVLCVGIHLIFMRVCKKEIQNKIQVNVSTFDLR